MQYSTIVDKDEQGLIQIIEAAKKFEEDRFLEGIHQRCYTAMDIQVATDRVREYQNKLNTEARALVYFSQTFLQQYATDNNKCFETAQMLFNRIRSTLKASRAVFKKTCPTRRRRQPVDMENRQSMCALCCQRASAIATCLASSRSRSRCRRSTTRCRLSSPPLSPRWPCVTI